MPSLELRLTYSAPNTKSAINRAIRAELVDGCDILDKLHQAADEYNRHPTQASREAYTVAMKRKRTAEYVIRTRYGIP